jgi:hypothetical protein
VAVGHRHLLAGLDVALAGHLLLGRWVLAVHRIAVLDIGRRLLSSAGRTSAGRVGVGLGLRERVP